MSPFSLGLGGAHVNLRVQVKRRRAMLASNRIVASAIVAQRVGQ